MKYLLLVRTRDPTRPWTAEVRRPYWGSSHKSLISKIFEGNL